MSLRQTKEFSDKPLKVAAVGQNKSSIDGKLKLKMTAWAKLM